MDSNRTPPYPNPTSPELLNRRARRVKQLARIYRDHYWALMEELKLKHREYYWEYGKSPFVEDEENENHLNSSLAAENGNGNLGVNGGNSASNGAIRCGVNGCKAKALALSKFCLMHILHDSKQRLYKSCTFTIKRYATLCIRENPGCLFIATNRDAVTHLTDAQEWAGGGSMVGAVGGSTQREPPVVGKPSTFMNHDGLFSRQICMVGDRLDTDILFGQNGGCMTLLVLSGVTSISMLQNPDNTIQPDFYTNKISDFLSLKAATV